MQVIDDNNYGVKGWLCRNEHAGAFEGEQKACKQFPQPGRCVSHLI